MEKGFDIKKFINQNKKINNNISKTPEAVYHKKQNEDPKNEDHKDHKTENIKYIDELYTNEFLDKYFET